MSKRTKFFVLVFFIGAFFLFFNADVQANSTCVVGDFSETAIQTVADMYPDYWDSDEYFWIGFHLNKDLFRYRFYCFKNVGDTKVYLTDDTGQHYDFSSNDFVYFGQVQLYNDGTSTYSKELFNSTYYDNQYILDNNSWCSGGISMMFRSVTQCGDSTKGAFYKNCNVYTDSTLSQIYFEGQSTVGKIHLTLGVSTTEQTTDTVEISTQFFDEYTFNNFDSYEYCELGGEYKPLHVKTLWDTELEQLTYSLYCNAEENATYQFKVVNSGYENIATMEITNIKKGVSETFFDNYVIDKNFYNSNVIDSLQLSYDYVNENTIAIHTQCFSLAQIRAYAVETSQNAIDYYELSAVQWNKPNDTNVYFTFGATVHEDGTYYFRLKNRATGETFGVTSFTVDFENIIKQHEQYKEQAKEEENKNFLDKIVDFFTSLVDRVGEMLSYLNPFSDKFFLKLAFTLTEEQEQLHKDNQEIFRGNLQAKIPFVQTLIDDFQKVVDAHTNIDSPNNPLNLEIGAFDMQLGVVSWQTEKTDLSFILEKYEPYRMQARNMLKLIVYAIGIVYLIKYYLNYGVTQGVDLAISTVRKEND